MDLLKKLARPFVPLVAAGALALGVAGIADAQSSDPNHFLACNSIVVAADNSVSYPGGLVGVKDVFGVNEPLVLVYNSGPYSKIGDSLKLDIYSPAGVLVDEVTNTASYDRDIWTEGENEGPKITQYLYSKGGYGKYRAVWSWNNQIQGEDDVTIQENPQPAPVYTPSETTTYAAPKSDLELRLGLGLGYETGSNISKDSLSNIPLLDAMPEIYFEFMSKHGIGFDMFLAGAMSQSGAYTKVWGNAGISSNNPEIIFSGDLTYHIPVDPVDFELFAGGGLFTDMGNAPVNSNPISSGFFAQGGAAITLNFLKDFFIQLRGAGRFYFSDETANSLGKYSPAPLGDFNISLLGGFSVK